MAKKKQEIANNKLVDQGELERQRQQAAKEELEKREKEK